MNKVEICGLETSKLPLISAKQSKELLQKIKSGDELAREEFIKANLRLVLSVIQKFKRNECMDDIFQVGCIGLIKAINNFDTSFDVKFSTYAVPMIMGEVRRYLRDSSGSVRVSRSLRDTAYRALSVRNSLAEQSSREPTLEEIAKCMDVSVEDVAFALEAIQDPVSLFEPIYHDDGDAIFVMDQLQDKRVSEDDWLDSISVETGIEKLAERERRILELRFFQGKTQMEVANEVGVSQAQVSRLEKNALTHMRRYV